MSPRAPSHLDCFLLSNIKNEHICFHRNDIGQIGFQMFISSSSLEDSRSYGALFDAPSVVIFLWPAPRAAKKRTERTKGPHLHMGWWALVILQRALGKGSHWLQLQHQKPRKSAGTCCFRHAKAGANGTKYSSDARESFRLRALTVFGWDLQRGLSKHILWSTLASAWLGRWLVRRSAQLALLVFFGDAGDASGLSSRGANLVGWRMIVLIECRSFWI